MDKIEKEEKILIVLIFLMILLISLSIIIQQKFQFLYPISTTSVTITTLTFTTFATTTTTVLPCILSNPVISPNCKRDCCLEGENISISFKLNNPTSCSQANFFLFKLKGKECELNVTLPVDISPNQEHISMEWKIPALPSRYLGDTIKGKELSLWEKENEKKIKISQSQDLKISGNITFCTPEKISRAENAICPIEYGELTCFYERVIIPFYNPIKSNITLKYIQVVMKIRNKEIISELPVPLKPNQTKVLILRELECPLKEKPENVTLRWICKDKFYEIKIGKEAGKTIILGQMENVTSISEERGYPLHPTLEDCEKLTSGVKNFCYDDVAEISGNVKICDKIQDDDIKKHCVARVLLNSSICDKIKDSGLREGCIESVEMKKRWLKE